MRRSLFLLVIFIFIYTPSADARTHAEVVQTRFEQLLDYWGYDAWWSMWEQGTARVRASVTVDEYAKRMSRNPWRPACCYKRIRHIETRASSDSHVVVRAIVVLEYRADRPGERVVPMTIDYYLEDGDWHLNLYALGF